MPHITCESLNILGRWDELPGKRRWCRWHKIAHYENSENSFMCQAKNGTKFFLKSRVKEFLRKFCYFISFSKPWLLLLSAFKWNIKLSTRNFSKRVNQPHISSGSTQTIRCRNDTAQLNRTRQTFRERNLNSFISFRCIKCATLTCSVYTRSRALERSTEFNLSSHLIGD